MTSETQTDCKKKCESSVIEGLIDSRIVKRLKHRYPIRIFPTRDGLIIRIQLKDLNAKLVDVFDIPANSEGFVHAETVIHFLVLAWEVCLYDQVLRAAGKRRQQRVLYIG